MDHSIFLFLSTSLIGICLQGALGSRVSCSFDQPSGLCEWNSDPDAPFHWRVGQGRSEDRVSGPRNDHTCQNKSGHYLYIAGKDADKGADATVWSPAVSLNQSQLFTFWYTMNGFGTGSLSLLRLENNSSVVLWFKAGHQSVSWLSANVTLNPGMFSLQFKATVRLPIASNLAIDDLHLLSEESQSLGRSYCMIPASTTPTTVTTTPTTVTITSSATTTTTVSLSTFPPICGSNESDLVQLPVICDFENSTCDLVVVANDTDPMVTWTRTNHPLDRQSVIFGDHTHEIKNATTGFYMDFQNNRRFGNFWKNPKYSASLKTPCIYSYSVCLSFWYSIPSQYSNLRVLLQGNSGLKQELWSRDNQLLKDDPSKIRNQSGWHLAILSVLGVPPYMIIFQTKNNFHAAAVGIDDIALTACTTTSSTTTLRTSHTEQTTSTALPVVDTSKTMYTVMSATNEPSLSTKESPTTVIGMSGPTTWAATTQAATTQLTTNKPDETSSSKFTKKSSAPTKKPPDTVGGNKDEQYRDKQNADKQRSNVGKIVGYSVGSVLAVLLVAVLLYMKVKLRKGAGKSRVKPRAQSALEMNQKAFGSNKNAEFKINGHIGNGFAKHAYMNDKSKHLEHHNSISETKLVDMTVETNVISTVTDECAATKTTDMRESSNVSKDKAESIDL